MMQLVEPINGSFQINTTTAGRQQGQVAATLASGKFVVVWQDSSGTGGPPDFDIKAQILDAQGNPIGGEIFVNTTTAGFQQDATVAALDNGGFVVTWINLLNGPATILGQAFDASGAKSGSEFSMLSGVDEEYWPQVAGLAGGGFAVTWVRHHATPADPSGREIDAQLFNDDGTSRGAAFLVSPLVDSNSTSPLDHSAIVALASGGFVVSWVDSRGTLGDSSGTAIAAQLYDSTGAPQGGQFRVNTSLPGDQDQILAVPLSGGGFVLGWTDNGDSLGTSVKAQVFTAGGAPVGSELRLANGTTLAELTGDHFLATWNASGLLKAQVYDLSGNKIGTDTTNVPVADVPVAAANSTGTLLVAWTNASSDSANPADVEGQLAIVTRFGTTGADNMNGTSGRDLIDAGAGNDFLHLEQGGSDAVQGGAGNDAFYFGAALDPTDQVDGGTEQDVVAIQGVYSGYTLGAHNLDNVETLSLLSHSDNRFGGGSAGLDGYDITSLDANVAAGQTLTINASTLQAGENFTFNGSAETDGSFFIYGGQGVDHLTGGANADVFFFAENGRFGPGDHVDGGPGNDILVLRGNYSIVMDASSMTNIETVTLMSGSDARFAPVGAKFSYDITTADNTVAAGATMTFNGGGLQAGETLHFNGSAELDGNFRIFGGADNDTLIGGAGNDLIYGGLGQDDLTGGGGADMFRYQTTTESTNSAPDHIIDFTSGTDKIDLSRIDANTNVAGDQAFTFIDSNPFDGHAGELRAVDSGLGYFNVQGDVNGDGIADFTIHVTMNGPNPIAGADFVP